MLSFDIESPGKVILHGEHSVVYGRPALAAAIGLTTKLRYREQSQSKFGSIHLETLNCTFGIPLEEFNEFLAKFRRTHPDEKFECTAKLLDEVRKQVAHIVTTTPQQHHKQRACLAIYYLLSGTLLSAPKPDVSLEQGFELHIDSELPIGAGLGSSASFGTALAAAFLLLAGHFNVETYLDPQNQELISQWSYESERLMHDTPSGVDNTVCTYGGMLRFCKGQGFKSLKVHGPLNILLVDSKVNRSTADVIAKVRHLIKTFPKVIEGIWDTCEELVNEAIPLYESFGNGQDDSEKFEKLERLFQINNDLLKAIGVTHSKLEQIFAIAFKRGFFSKLTGAGAGGFAIVLLPKNYEENPVYGKLKEELEAAGFGVRATTAGGLGLRMIKSQN